MKLVSLNVWGGKKFSLLMDFIQTHSKDTDIFCFQEIFDTATEKVGSHGFRLNLLAEISKILPDFQPYFASCVDNYIAGAFLPNFTNFDLSWGLATFVNKKITVSSCGDFFVFGKRDNFDPTDLNSLPRNMQYITFAVDNEKFLICNLHGIWRKGRKIDHPTRISQSEQIKNFMEEYKDEKKILCGDFNLNIDTKSLQLLEDNMKNLIKEYNIPTTRSKLYTWGDKFADYMLVSDNINISNFQVPEIEVSDHLPMILQFS